jgi:uncharacterized membrane protein (DUF2068 family)
VQAHPKVEPALRLIILYKLAKASLGIACSALLWGFLFAGSADRVLGLAADVRHHVTAAWSIRLADAFVSAADKRHLVVLASALALDGAATLFEWYALRTARPWGAWLVVLTTASLVPFEIVAIFRHRRAGRVVLLMINMAIVVYLVRRTLRKRGRPLDSPAAGAAPPARTGTDGAGPATS